MIIFDKEKYLRHKNYLENNYKKPFKPNQGLEEIFEIIQEFSDGDSWIDLGSGATSFLWNIPMKKKNSINFVDIDMEIETLIKELQCTKYNDGCFKYAFETYSDKTASDVYNQNYIYYTYDLLNKKITFNQQYDLVTQFGLLGLCNNKQHFIEKTEEIINILNDNGTYIGANWVYSSKRIIEKQHNNTFITTELIYNIANKFNLSVEKIKKIDILNDSEFDSIILYVLKKKTEKLIGFQQIFDCYNVDIEKIDTISKIKQIIHSISNTINHKILKENYHQFSPNGITGFAIISGSHIAVHTWPEYNYISIDVFSCYHKKEKNKIIDIISNLLKTDKIVSKELSRKVYELI